RKIQPLLVPATDALRREVIESPLLAGNVIALGHRQALRVSSVVDSVLDEPDHEIVPCIVENHLVTAPGPIRNLGQGRARIDIRESGAGVGGEGRVPVAGVQNLPTAHCHAWFTHVAAHIPDRGTRHGHIGVQADALCAGRLDYFSGWNLYGPRSHTSCLPR